MPEATLCEQLADYVVSLRFDSIHHDAIERAKAIVLHNLAVSFGGVGTDQVNKALEFAGRSAGVSTVIAHPHRMAATDAAFVNSIATRALRQEDMVIPSQAHPGACLVPTALALAEECGSSGAEVLASIVIGFDLIAKPAGQVFTIEHARRTPSHIWNALGVAAAAARLMGLDHAQTTGALAHACNLGAMIMEGIQDFQYGILTRNGILAARFGKCRAPFPADALEGPKGLYAVQLHGRRPPTAEIVGTLGTQFEITRTILKPHPCTGINLVALELMRRLRREHGLTPENVRLITVKRSPATQGEPTIHFSGPFTGYLGGMYQATSSLPFGVAAVLADGDVTHAHFESPNDPRLAEIMRRVNVEFHERPDLLDNEIHIETQDGRRMELRGGAECLAVPDAAPILARFARQHVGVAKTEELPRQVARLDSLLDIRELTRCLA
jgi:2-methylcitrate dehydratase PrpD